MEIPVLERRLGSIAAIAQVAPLVGLLGTLLGMITTFHAFMQGGNYATATALSAGHVAGSDQHRRRPGGGHPRATWPTISSAAGSAPSCGTWSGRGNEIMKYLLGEYRKAPAGGGGRRPRRKAMITHPLDLASRLRPPPRSFDALFLVNGGLIILFFFLFGSRFVLAPGLGVGFQLPEMAAAGAGAAPTARSSSACRAPTWCWWTTAC